MATPNVFRLLVTECNVIFDIVEVLSWILKERIVAGLVRVLELLVRTVFRVGLFGMLFPPISRFFLRIHSAAAFIAFAVCCFGTCLHKSASRCRALKTSPVTSQPDACFLNRAEFIS
jgi:hypothetical protein